MIHRWPPGFQSYEDVPEEANGIGLMKKYRPGFLLVPRQVNLTYSDHR